MHIEVSYYCVAGSTIVDAYRECAAMVNIYQPGKLYWETEENALNDHSVVAESKAEAKTEATGGEEEGPHQDPVTTIDPVGFEHMDEKDDYEPIMLMID